MCVFAPLPGAAYPQRSTDVHHGRPVRPRRRRRRRQSHNLRKLHRPSLLPSSPLSPDVFIQANRVTDKLTHIHDRLYCCRSGSAADTQAIADIVHWNCQLTTCVERASPHSASNLPTGRCAAFLPPSQPLRLLSRNCATKTRTVCLPG